MAAPSAVYPPEVWALESLIVLQNTHVAANLVHRNFENEVARFGDVVHTRKPTLGTVQALTNNAAMTVQTLAATDVSITLDQHRYTAFRVSDRDMSTSIKNLVQEFVEPYMIPIAKQVDDDLLGTSCLTSTVADSMGNTIPTVAVASAPIAIGDLAAVRGQLRTNQVPVIRPDIVHGILGTQHETEVLSNTTLVQANTFGDNPPALQTGFVTTLYGMSIFADQGVPLASTTDQSVFFHRNAAALVTRPLEVPAMISGTGQRAAVAQKDGVGIRVIMSYDHTRLSTLVSYDLLYGFKLLDAKLATILQG